MAGALLEKAGDRHFTWGYLGSPFSWQKGWIKMDINCDTKRKRDIHIYIYILYIYIYMYISRTQTRNTNFGTIWIGNGCWPFARGLLGFVYQKGAEFHWTHDFDHLEGSTGFQWPRRNNTKKTNLYMYCVCVFIYIYIHLHVYIYIHMYEYIYICMNVYIYIDNTLYICMYCIVLYCIALHCIVLYCIVL